MSVSFDATQKVLVNNWNMLSDVASPPIAVNVKQPTAIYVKVFMHTHITQLTHIMHNTKHT